MKKSVEWIKHHQITSFIILTLGFSWIFFVLSYLVFAENLLIQALCGKIAVFGPAMIAMLISGISYSEPKLRPSKIRWWIFGIVWLFSWIILVSFVMLVRNVPFQVNVCIVFGICALLPAWIISASRSSIPGIRLTFSTLSKPRGSFIWYVVAFTGYPVILLISVFITRLSGNNVSFPNLSLSQACIFLLLMFFEGFLASGGVNEESGWRGFLLPHLQDKYSVIVASIIVWFFWSLWHLPLDIMQKVPVQQILLNRLLFNFLASVLFVWVYNRSRGSILAPAIFHASMNTAGAFIPASLTFLIPLVILCVIAFVNGRMWKRLPQDHLAVHKESLFISTLSN
jgi:membrane protease YdiL (CAAX protease family)